MLPDKIVQLKESRAKTEALAAEVAQEIKATLRGLPSLYDFPDAKSFCRAIMAASKAKPGRKAAHKPAGRKKSALANPVAAKESRKPRAVIDQAMKERVKLETENKLGANQIATLLGISPASVRNIWKELGIGPKK